MYQALYRSFRPETFDAVLGQEHIVRILKNQISGGTTSHAYLFCGTRGTGKTTTARLLAKGVNCLSAEDKPCGICENCQSIKNGTFMDVMEIDAASNNGVENIRELRESVKYPPVTGKIKVYIIDEVHMLSTGAFNALLKTLEEPPEHVMFILATTEVHKLPATILSRCLRLDFHRVPERQLKQGMGSICSQLNISIEESALGLIASNADGSVRDALSLLDQCIAGDRSDVKRDTVLELLGTAGEDVFVEMTDYVTVGRTGEALLLLNRILEDGKDVRQFMKDWIGHFRNLLLTKYIKKPEELLNMSAENVERIRSQSERVDLQVINQSILVLSKTINDARWSTQPRILLELCIVKMAMGDGEELPVRRSAVSRSPETATSRTAMPAVGRADLQDRKMTQGAHTVASQAAEAVPADKAAEGADIETVILGEAERDIPPCGEPQQPDGEMSEQELDDVWYRVFEDGETMQGSFNLLRSGSRLCHMDGQSFTIGVSNEVLKKYAKENASTLERLMAKHTGRQRHMECILDGETGTAGTSYHRDPVDALKDSIEKRLGLSVDME